jgi:hypothetical protein
MNKRKNHSVWNGIVEENRVIITTWDNNGGIRLYKRIFNLFYEDHQTAKDDYTKRYKQKRRKGYLHWNEINKDS